MEALETITLEIDSLERLLNRRAFLRYAAMAAVVPRLALDQDDREYLRKVAATLIPAEALSGTGIEVVANIDRLLARGSAEHRAKVLRLVAWARRVSFLYGGEQIALRARGSRFTLVQKLGNALSALCLVAFWGDERALRLIAAPERV